MWMLMPLFHFCASSLLPQDKFSVAEFSWKVFWRMKKYGKVWSRAHAVWLKLDARIGKKKYTPQKLNHGIFIFNAIILPVFTATSNCKTYLILSDCFGITRRSRSDVSEWVSALCSYPLKLGKPKFLKVKAQFSLNFVPNFKILVLTG